MRCSISHHMSPRREFEWHPAAGASGAHAVLLSTAESAVCNLDVICRMVDSWVEYLNPVS